MREERSWIIDKHNQDTCLVVGEMCMGSLRM